MNYKPLKITFYENKELFLEEYNKRFESYSTLKTGLEIHPFDKGERIISKKLELFYVASIEHQMLVDSINKNSRQIKSFLQKLPGLVNKKLFLAQLIEEIQSTNDIEGIQSTRKEIGEAIQKKDLDETVRFQGIVNMYVNLGDDGYQKIDEVTKIRLIYDELFGDDIPEEEQPDGKLFRKNAVYIGNDYKRVHQGNPSEETIIRDLNKLVTFMNRKDLPFLLKCAISHYFFEYVHPFYDGNGRMGRFLMSNYLTRKLDSLTGITISNAVIHSKGKYENAFSEVSNPRNMGDLTLFVQSIYELILSGQLEIIKELENASAKLNNAFSYLKSLGLDKDSNKVLSVLIQHYLFNFDDESIKDIEMRKITKLTNYKISNIYKKLVNAGYVIQTGKNPLIHELSSIVMDNID